MLDLWHPTIQVVAVNCCYLPSSNGAFWWMKNTKVENRKGDWLGDFVEFGT